jgi:hypothetical protein
MKKFRFIINYIVLSYLEQLVKYLAILFSSLHIQYSMLPKITRTYVNTQ